MQNRHRIEYQYLQKGREKQIKNYFASSDPRTDTLCWHSIWHFFSHILWHSIWHSCWHFVALYLAFYLRFVLIFCLAYLAGILSRTYSAVFLGSGEFSLVFGHVPSCPRNCIAGGVRGAQHPKLAGSDGYGCHQAEMRTRRNKSRGRRKRRGWRRRKRRKGTFLI